MPNAENRGSRYPYLCAALTWAVCNGGCAPVVAVEVERAEAGDARFELGAFDGGCDPANSTESVTYEKRVALGVTYCRIVSTWSGTLLSMNEVRAGIQEELDARGAPVDATQVEVEFTDIEITDVEVGLVRDGEALPFPALTYYRTEAGIDAESRLLAAEWPNAGAAVDDPAVTFLDDNGTAGKDALLEHLNAQYAIQADVLGVGRSEMEFAYDAVVLESLRGAELSIGFEIQATANGGASLTGVFGI